MTRTGHHLVGVATGLCVAAGIRHLWPESAWYVAIVAGWFGGVAPDRLEYAGRYRWVTHRTLTHWGLLWAGLAAWAGWLMSRAIQPNGLVVFLAGFACGGLSHLLGDWPNPMGVPWWLPTRRRSLNGWLSGQHEMELASCAFGMAWLAWRLLDPNFLSRL